MCRLVAKCCLKLGDWYDTLPQSTKDVQAVNMNVQQSLSPVKIPQQPSANPSIVINVPPLLLDGNHVKIPSPPLFSPNSHVVQPLQPSSPSQSTLTQTMKFYANATVYDPTWYKAWHKLASAYFNAAMYQTQNSVSSATLLITSLSIFLSIFLLKLNFNTETTSVWFPISYCYFL